MSSSENPMYPRQRAVFRLVSKCILQAVDGSRVRVEDVPTLILVPVLLHVSDHDETYDGLILAFIGADRAKPMFVSGSERLFDPAEQLSVLLVDRTKPRAFPSSKVFHTPTGDVDTSE